MARKRETAGKSSHAALAEKVLSAAGGLRAGLAAEGPLPTRRDIRTLVEELLEVLFPESHRMGTDGGNLRGHVAATIAALEPRLERAIHLGLHRLHKTNQADGCKKRAAAITAKLLAALPDVRARLAKDVLAAFDSDPAASGIDEILLTYPGAYAVTVYRIAHALLREGAVIVPRMMTELAHRRTGIDIHPGAEIGRAFFIDHGTGVVIGETTRIGDRVRIYQGVTLGALTVPQGETRPEHGTRRHPTIEDDVVIYANATILGGETVIGKGAVIGGNAFITASVAPGAKISGSSRTQK